MTTLHLLAELTKAHYDFTNMIDALEKESFEFSPSPEVWSAGQQLEHILKSIRPVNLGLSLPLFIPKLIFGKTNLPGRNYDAIVEKYKLNLANGLKAPAPYVPKAVSFEKKDVLISGIEQTIASIVANVGRKTEKELDSIRFPHPSLGKLTIREMLYFTLYHVKHHHLSVEKRLNR